jgi:hypothetical protein
MRPGRSGSATQLLVLRKRGTIGGHNPVETRRNPAKERSATAAQKWAYLQGKSECDRVIGVCWPCTRSWVRVPSAAWKALQIGTFLVLETVSVVRRRSRLRSPSADLGKAPANRQVPAASSPRFARADEGFLELGDDWGTEPSAPQAPTQRPRARLRTRPHGSPSLPDVAPSDAHPPSLVRQLTLLVKARAGLALANPWRLPANRPTAPVPPPPRG